MNKNSKGPYKSLFSLGLPVLVTQIGIISVSFADTIMVGHYGLEELAAASFVNNLFMVPMVMLIGFAAGITPIVGAFFGADEKLKIGSAFRAGMQVNTFLSLALMALMAVIYFFLPYFGQPEEIMPLVRQYYLIVLLAMLPTALFNCCQQTCNGVTDTATPMWIILGSNLLNIFGNYVLIFGKFGCPALGLAGAGISTLIARLAGFIVLFLIMTNWKRYKPFMEGRFIRENRGEIRKKVWNTSYPIMVQSGVECSLWSIGAVVCGWFGKVQLASYQVINTISQLGFMIFMSFGVALSIKVANFTGTGDVASIRKFTGAGLRMNIFLATGAMLLFLFFAKPLIQIFTPDSQVILAAEMLIFPLILYQYCDATQLTYIYALRGTGNVRPLLWISITSYLIIGVPAMMLLAKVLDWQSVGVYYSFSSALLAAAILLFVTYRKTIRKEDEKQ